MQATNWLRDLVYQFGFGVRLRNTLTRGRRRGRRPSMRPRHLFASAYSPEPLEQRTLLAATATFDMGTGNLTVNADTPTGNYGLTLTADNTVEFFDGITSEGTFGPVTGTITVNLGAGNEELKLDLDGFSLDASVVINAGGGSDTVLIVDDSAMANGAINNSVTVNLGEGDDDIVLTDIDITGDVMLHAGNGDNYVSVGYENPTGQGPVTITGDLTVTSGTGDDKIYLEATSVLKDGSMMGGNVSVTTGDADLFDIADLFEVTIEGDASIISGDGDDGIYLQDSTVDGNVTINSGNADPGDIIDDLVDVGNVQVGGTLGITTGDGDDEVFVFDSTTGDLTISTSSGLDAVSIDPTLVDGNLTVNTGDDDDDIDVIATDVTGDAQINSGTGNDYLYLNNFGVAGMLTINTGASDALPNPGDVVEGIGVTVDGNISISSTSGFLDVGGSLGGFTSTGGSISVQASGTGSGLSVGAPLTANSGNLSLTADEMFINADISSGVVTLQQANNPRPISLSPPVDVPGSLNLNVAELNRITADVVRIGDAANSGDISIDFLVANILDFDTLVLSTAGSIVDNLDNTTVGGVPDIIIAKLALNADQSIGVGAEGALELDVNTLAFASNGMVELENDGSLTINTVGGLTSSSAGGGSVTANSPLTIAHDVNLAGDFTFTAGASSSDNDHLAINSDATVSLTSGNPSTLTLNAGDDIEFGAEGGPGAGAGQVVTTGATHTVNLNADTEGAGGGDAYRGLVRQGQAVVSVTTQNLNIDAAGGIGISGAEFVFDAEALNSTSTGGGVSGDQFLVESNAVNVQSIDAGNADVNLLGGLVLVVGTVSAGHVAVGSNSGGATILGGNGTVDAPTVTVHHLGSGISPGESAGVLNIVSGHLTIVGTYEVELGGTSPGIGMGFHDQINLTGGLELENGLLNVQLSDGFIPQVGDTFIIVNNDGSDIVDGNFGSLPEDAIIVVGGQPLQITYEGGDGNDVVLTAVAFANGADLEVTKSDDPDQADPGQEITYTIEVANNGPFDATTVSLEDVIPANTTFVDFVQNTGPAFTLNAPAMGATGTAEATIALLEVGDMATFTLVVKVDDDAEVPLITNTATINSADVGDPEPTNNSAMETTDVTPPDFDFGDAPDSIATPMYPTLDANLGAKHKIVSPTPFLGTVSPDIDADGQPTVAADGDDTDGSDDEDGVAGLGTPLITGEMHEITVTVDAGMGTANLNAWVDFNADGDWDDAGEQVATDLSLATGDHSIMIDVPLDAALGETYARFRLSTESGLGTGGRAEDGEVEDYILTIIPPTPLFDLILEKTESTDPVVAGSGADNLTYVVTVTNDGPSDAEDVVITEDLTLPAGVSFVSATTSTMDETFTPTGPGADGEWSIPLLPAGESRTLTIVLTVAADTADGATISNTAAVASIGPDQMLINTDDDTVTETTTVDRLVDLVVTKEDSTDPVVAGTGTGNLTYTITVENDGPSDATGVMLNEDLTLPAGVTFESITPSQGIFSETVAPDGVWNVGSLTSGASATLTVVLTATLNAADDSVISNTVAVSSANETLINTGDDTVTETTTVQNELSNLELQVTPTVNEGSTATLTGSFLNEAQSHTVTINWGDGESSSITIPANTFDFQTTHEYLDDAPSGTPQDPYTIFVTVTDSGADTTTANTSLIVQNVAPVFTSLTINPSTVQTGGVTTISGTFSDPGALDTHLLDFDLDNDGIFEINSLPPDSPGSFSFEFTINQPPGELAVNARIRDDDTGTATSTRFVTVTQTQDAVVLDSRIFYNNSSFDGADAASDVAAIDTSKASLGLGQAATIANLSGFTKGLNGVTFVVSDLPDNGANLTAGDFAVRLGTTNNVNAWVAGPAPTLQVLPDSAPGGGDRVMLYFADNAIQDTYASFQMLATANTGLAQPHTAIFGNVRGETGAAFSGQGQFFGRGAADLQAMAQPGVLFQPAGVTSVTDVNKDAVTDAFDFQGLAVAGISQNVLPVITPAFAAVPAPGFAAAADEAMTDDSVADAASFPPNGGNSPGANEDGRVAASGEEERDLAFASFSDAENVVEDDLVGALAGGRTVV